MQGGYMGLFKWLQKRGLAGMIPKNAYEQYQKWQRKDATLSESEISQGIFSLRYIMGNPILNRKEVYRLGSYIESDFECESLIDFCLVSLDVEGHIDPSDGKAFYNTAEIIIEELKRLGFEVVNDKVSPFVDKWNNHIFSYRR
jgi:hypothetical protein